MTKKVSKAAKVMDLINRGTKSNKEIAAKAKCTASYVWHIRKIMAKGVVPAGAPVLELTPKMEVKPVLTGGSSDYYKLHIPNPTSGEAAYIAECNDIIEALNMNYAEGNAFKAVWRRAALRAGGGKPGSTILYESEKVEFFGRRLVEQARER